MAFTLSEKVNERIGRKRFKLVQATHDGSATSITAASLGFNYITFCIPVSATALSDATDMPVLTTNSGTSVAMNNLSSGTLTDLILVGY